MRYGYHHKEWMDNMPRKEYTSLLGNINAMIGKSGKKTEELPHGLETGNDRGRTIMEFLYKKYIKAMNHKHMVQKSLK